MDPLKIANTMAQAAQQKSADPMAPKKKSPKQVAAAKEQEQSKGQLPPKPNQKAPQAY